MSIHEQQVKIDIGSGFSTSVDSDDAEDIASLQQLKTGMLLLLMMALILKITRMFLTNPIRIISNDKLKLLKSIYFTSNVFIC